MSSAQGEAPKSSPDDILSGWEVMELRDNLIWPIADKLWHDDFLTSATPGESLEFSRTLITPHGWRRAAVQVGCYIDSDIDEDEDPEPIHAVNVRFEVPQYDLTDSLLEAALKDFPVDMRDEFEEEFADVVQAWQVHQYDFDTRPDFGLEETEHS
jgi:hypothetical protein